MRPGSIPAVANSRRAALAASATASSCARATDMRVTPRPSVYLVGGVHHERRARIPLHPGRVEGLVAGPALIARHRHHRAVAANDLRRLGVAVFVHVIAPHEEAEPRGGGTVRLAGVAGGAGGNLE